MEYKIEVRPLATLEIIEAYDWYELQQSGLGDRFLKAVDTFFDSLLRNPNIYTYYDKPVRQGKLDKFPYVVVYELIEQTLVIYSVFMAKQNPDKKRSM